MRTAKIDYKDFREWYNNVIKENKRVKIIYIEDAKFYTLQFFDPFNMLYVFSELPKSKITEDVKMWLQQKGIYVSQIFT